MHIQQVLREELRGSTVITIAHRLEAVRNADYYIRLSNGRVLRQGSTMDDAMREQEEGEAIDGDADDTPSQ